MRSIHNVGSLFRTSEGLGIEKLLLTGYTPHPVFDGDNRLPHLALKQDKAIDKTALGAQNSLAWEYTENINDAIEILRASGYSIISLEQTEKAIELHKYNPPDKIAIVLGTEVTGLPQDILERTDEHVYIPMFGKKESFNVVQAAAMTMYRLRFY